jgi:hypothetical protein
VRISIALLALVAAADAATGRPLEAELPPARDTCYARTYDAAYLAAHPAQKVASVRLVHAPGDGPGPTFSFLDIRLRGGAKRYKLFGFCKASGSGLACAPEWDAGTWRLEKGPGGTLDVVNGGVTLNPLEFDAEEVAPDSVALPSAPDDRRWRLQRLPGSAPCTTG